MGKALIIGAGGVGRVVAHKCAQNPDVFKEIIIASRTLSKCDELKKELEGGQSKVHTAQVDADKTEEVINLINRFKPDIVINVALPYQDLSIMEACL
ncbi:MAG TPA: saccharopine dehydrogenase NADP-binding domain-containing protein, partial [Mobilitalea sp.]|nr:saccharopine dehydrogenase NADP-binding domain-containing protein [Mobilitalea sp.]